MLVIAYHGKSSRQAVQHAVYPVRITHSFVQVSTIVNFPRDETVHVAWNGAALSANA